MFVEQFGVSVGFGFSDAARFAKKVRSLADSISEFDKNVHADYAAEVWINWRCRSAICCRTTAFPADRIWMRCVTLCS